MSDEQIDLYLQQGIYGTPETKPEERNKFLGTLRERIELALTNGQVRQKKYTAKPQPPSGSEKDISCF